MRILHTSDWHFGRNIENFSRQEEQEAFSKELVKIATDEKVDLCIVAGDIFDSFNPPVWAQKLYYETLKNLTDNGVGVIVAAGNHDSPQGLCSAESLARSCGVIMCEFPLSVAETGDYGKLFTIIESGEGWFALALKNGEKAVIAALPYPSESRIAKAVEYSEGEANIKADYNKRLGELMNTVCSNFKPDCANIMISHIYVNGGKTSDSERNFQLGGAYAVMGNTIPAECDYVALGHLHRPQKAEGCLCPAYYSGSPMSYSFSEAGYAKSVYVVDIKNHKTEMKTVQLESGRSLVSVTLDGAEEAVRWCREQGNNEIWAELKINTDMPITAEQLKIIREACPGVVSVQPQLTGSENVAENAERRLGKSLEESFADFYKLKMGADMPEKIKNAFAELRGEN